jgi:hypothetical protein
MYHTASRKGIPGVITAQLYAQSWCHVVQNSLHALPSRSDLFFTLGSVATEYIVAFRGVGNAS